MTAPNRFARRWNAMRHNAKLNGETTMLDMDKLNAAVRARREPLGLNVRFVNARGENDEYSFRDEEQVTRFRANLTRRGYKLLD